MKRMNGSLHFGHWISPEISTRLQCFLRISDDLTSVSGDIVQAHDSDYARDYLTCSALIFLQRVRYGASVTVDIVTRIICFT